MINFIKNSLKVFSIKHYKAERKKIEHYKKFINVGDLVFDVGANIGNRVETFLKLQAKIVAIEPNIQCVKILKKKFGNRIKYENVGLAEKNDELDFHISNISTLSTFSDKFIKATSESGRFSDYKWEKVVRIEVKTLDLLIEKYGVPKFIKIDTEGFDEQVIKGLTKKIDFISFEYTLPELKEELLRTMDFLMHLGEIKVNVSIGESMVMLFENWINGSEFYEMVKLESSVYNDMNDFGDVYIAMN